MKLLFYGSDPDSEDAKQLLMCSSFGNSGPLPLVFVDALLKHQGDSLPKAVAYVSLYLLGWSPLFWIFGPMILSKKDPNAKTVSAEEKRKELIGRILRLKKDNYYIWYKEHVTSQRKYMNKLLKYMNKK